MHYSEPWFEVTKEQSEQLSKDVAKSITPSHLLYEADYKVIAKRIDRNQALCEVFGYQWRFAVVDLPDINNPNQGLVFTMRIRDEEAWERRLESSFREFVHSNPSNDLELEMDEEIARIILQMPVQCELACCGFDSIEWSQSIFDSNASRNLKTKMLSWLVDAIRRIQSKRMVRFVECNMHGILSSDPELTVELFRDAIASIEGNGKEIGI
jgi:hypothetical protein